MANLRIHYPLIPAVAPEKRRENAKHAIARGLPRLERRPDEDGVLHLACYGPSLRDTFERLRGQAPILSMSGATKWLAARGITPNYSLEMDPRPYKAKVSLPPVPGVHYLIASCVDPAFFDEVLAAGNPVTLWHTVNTNYEEELNWSAAHDYGALVLHGGSTVGLTAIHMGGVLGYKRFEIHGMDGSFSEEDSGERKRHADAHPGKTQKPNIKWSAGGKRYWTSKIMANAVSESINTAKNFPIVTVWHGEGLTQALIREANLVNACCYDETEKRERLATLRPRIISKVPATAILTGNYWATLLRALWPDDLAELVRQIPVCEARRPLARYNTGTVPFESAAYLRALSRRHQPQVVTEVGTFIGTSTHALQASRALYTCDRSNDCVPSSGTVYTHPYRSSTEMLREIQEPVDLFFFDGRIQAEDLAEITRLKHDASVFVLDDYVPGQKGFVNATILGQLLPGYTVTPPGPGPSTLAVMAPGG